MSSPTLCFQGIESNSDISGPGVRIALYLQSILSVLLVRFSPKDAPGAYWSMTSTALSLIISSIVTSAMGIISLLDAIVVVYVLLLPILVSAFGLSEIMASSPHKNAVHKVHSPLLIIANWTRCALTYTFALYVWITAPTFGAGPKACNEATRLIFFGASLPALGAGRILNLAGWGLLTALFLWRTLKGGATIIIAFRALFSSNAAQALLKPKSPVLDEVYVETEEKRNFSTGEISRSLRMYRPMQIFHEVLRGMISQILGWAPSSEGKWYSPYGQMILMGLLAAWVIIMTELELVKNPISGDSNREWGFGQVLPMVLTISPLFALYESVLARRTSGPQRKDRLVRITIKSAAALQRPQCELDGLSPQEIELVMGLKEDQVKRIRAPSPFAVLTIDEQDIYVTYDQDNATDPDWEESFDVKMGDLSTVVIQIFDLKCMDNGWPSLIGFTTFLPYAILPPEDENIVSTEDRVGTETLTLARNGRRVPGMTATVSISTDVKSPVPAPKIPPRFLGLAKIHVARSVGIISFRGKRLGSSIVTVTETHRV